MDTTQERETAYIVARRKWAHEQERPFRNDVMDLMESFGIDAEEDLLDRICGICVNNLLFGYPAEYRLAELIAGQDRDSVLEQTMLLLRKYRAGFAETRRKQEN